MSSNPTGTPPTATSDPPGATNKVASKFSWDAHSAAEVGQVGAATAAATTAATTAAAAAPVNVSSNPSVAVAEMAASDNNMRPTTITHHVIPNCSAKLPTARRRDCCRDAFFNRVERCTCGGGGVNSSPAATAEAAAQGGISAEDRPISSSSTSRTSSSAADRAGEIGGPSSIASDAAAASSVSSSGNETTSNGDASKSSQLGGPAPWDNHANVKESITPGRVFQPETLVYAAPEEFATTSCANFNDCTPEDLRASGASLEQCRICLDPLVNPHVSSGATPELKAEVAVVSLEVCRHIYHRGCIESAMRHSYQCPVCRAKVGGNDIIQGKSPSASMTIDWIPTRCAGHEDCKSDGTIIIQYDVPGGTQKSYHVHPGRAYFPTMRRAYLPNSEGGRKLLSRLRHAFSRGLTFDVGTSMTTGRDDCVTWASIHHKTSLHGGLLGRGHGYPDESYVVNCNRELDGLGVPSAEDIERCNQEETTTNGRCYEQSASSSLTSSGNNPNSLQRALSQISVGLGNNQSHQATFPPGTAAAAAAQSPYHQGAAARGGSVPTHAAILFLLMHASQCLHRGGSGGSCPASPFCAWGKALWRHVKSCTDTNCQYRNCLLSRYVLDHYPSCTEDACTICFPVRRATASGQDLAAVPVPRAFVASLASLASPTCSAGMPSFYFETKAESAFGGNDGATKDPLSGLLESITKPEFVHFMANCGILGASVNLNPHAAKKKGGTGLRQSFVAEGLACVGRMKDDDTDDMHLRVAFHGTDEKNIDSILKHGLDPSKRRRQQYGQGEYFAAYPSLPLRYCNGGKVMLIFAVMAGRDNIHAISGGQGIVVVSDTRRQLPVATVTFGAVTSDALKSSTQFQQHLNLLLKEKADKERLSCETQCKAKLIQLLVGGEILAASDLYKGACVDGHPPTSWAHEISVYVRDIIRDDVFATAMFPNLPPRPQSNTLNILSVERCEQEATEARDKYEYAKRQKLGNA